MCDDLLNVFLQKPFSAQSLVLGYVNEFVCQQLWIIRAVSASNDAVALTADKGGQPNLERILFGPASFTILLTDATFAFVD